MDLTDPRNALLALAAEHGVDLTDPGWVEVFLEIQRVEFENDGSPMLPWAALALAAEYRKPTPAWVYHYLLAVASGLPGTIRNVPGGNEAEAVGKLLGFGSPGAGKAPRGKAWVARRNDMSSAIATEIERQNTRAGGRASPGNGRTKAAEVMAARAADAKDEFERLGLPKSAASFERVHKANEAAAERAVRELRARTEAKPTDPED